ncbi:MAG TPA: hypothetical protein VM577_02605 [Anaerovoracaceae bacterium]|nr:hypothetical protein [Anaerovoracaceae bacterium]
MPKLNQIIAIEKGTKSQTTRDLTDAHQALQKAALLSGISRTYRPRDEENGEKLPAENTRVQVRATDMIRKASEVLTKLFDVTATKDVANCNARADVIVDGLTIMKDAPVTYLLFLEKQLVDLHTFVKKLPVLDPSEDWHRDASTDSWATEPAFSVKTKKIPRNHVKAEATDKHPAQVEVYHEDIVVGEYKTIKFSGSVPQKDVNHFLTRVERLQEAVKFARETANGVEVQDQKVGKAIFDYIFSLSN